MPQPSKSHRWVVQEVAKYIRSSERFTALVSGLASRQEAVAAVTKFSFAPQRVSSTERPLIRFVVFASSIMEALAVEVETQTSKPRSEWAAGLLRQMHGECLVTVGMLADLSDDCANLTRRTDKLRVVAVELAIRLGVVFQFIPGNHVQGGM